MKISKLTFASLVVFSQYESGITFTSEATISVDTNVFASTIITILTFINISTAGSIKWCDHPTDFTIAKMAVEVVCIAVEGTSYKTNLRS